jgi:hypothetical protein
MAGAPPLGTLRPKQCVIKTPGKLFAWGPSDSVSHTVWVNNLHIRLERGTASPKIGSLIEWAPADPKRSVLWMSNMTLQGDDKEGAGGLLTKGGSKSLILGALLHLSICTHRGICQGSCLHRRSVAPTNSL